MSIFLDGCGSGLHIFRINGGYLEPYYIFKNPLKKNLIENFLPSKLTLKIHLENSGNFVKSKL